MVDPPAFELVYGWVDHRHGYRMEYHVGCRKRLADIHCTPVTGHHKLKVGEMIQHVSWYQDVSEEEAVRHTMSKPTMEDIVRLLYRLDADEFPSLTLALDEKGQLFPKLFVYGGSSGYAISLSQGDPQGNPACEMLSYINPDARDLPYSYRMVGRTYPGLEIEERFFTSDIDLVVSLIQHFSDT